MRSHTNQSPDPALTLSRIQLGVRPMRQDRDRIGICAAAIVVAVFAVHPVQAQIGLSKSEIESRYRIEESTKQRNSSLSNENAAIEKLKLVDPRAPRSLPLIVGVSTSDGRCVSIYGFKEFSTEVGDIQATLLACSSHALTGSQKRVKWKLHADFASVFPPIGVPFAHSWSFPIHRSTGVQTRSITIDPRTKRVVGTTPWSDITAPTGRWFTDATRGVDSTSKLVFVSDDAALYALAVITVTETNRYKSTKVDEFWIAEADFFWSAITADIASKSGGDDYESDLRRIIAAESASVVQQRRLATAFARIVDDDSLGWDRLQSEFRRLTEKDPASSSFIEEELLREIAKASVAQRKGRLAVLGEFGTRRAIGPVTSLLLRRSAVDDEVRSIARRIAAREQIPPPPDDSAPPSAWVRWAEANGQGP